MEVPAGSVPALQLELQVWNLNVQVRRGNIYSTRYQLTMMYLVESLTTLELEPLNLGTFNIFNVQTLECSTPDSIIAIIDQSIDRLTSTWRPYI